MLNEHHWVQISLLKGSTIITLGCKFTPAYEKNIYSLHWGVNLLPEGCHLCDKQLLPIVSQFTPTFLCVHLKCVSRFTRMNFTVPLIG